MTGAEREPDALADVRERLAALLPEAGFPTLLDEVTAVVGDALRQARAEALREAAADAWVGLDWSDVSPEACEQVRQWLHDCADREEQGQ